MGHGPTVIRPSWDTRRCTGRPRRLKSNRSRIRTYRRLEAVGLAFQLGNDREASDTRGLRAMHLAARSGYHNIIKFLAERGADLNPLTKPRAERGYGTSQQLVEGQTPLALVEGSVFNS